MFLNILTCKIFKQASKINANIFCVAGIDPDVHLKSGWTCLMLAASSSSYELMEFLVNRGANVNFHKGILFRGNVISL